MQITEHLSLEEMTFSEAALRNGWDNTPNAHQFSNLTRTAELLEKVRGILNAPIIVNSAFRNQQVNAAVGGKSTSQHRNGCAADIKVHGMTPDQVCMKILQSGILFDQLIREFNSWTHISVPEEQDGIWRKQALIIDSTGTRPFIWK